MSETSNTKLWEARFTCWFWGALKGWLQLMFGDGDGWEFWWWLQHDSQIDVPLPIWDYWQIYKMQFPSKSSRTNAKYLSYLQEIGRHQ